MTKIKDLPKVRNKYLNDVLKSKHNSRHDDKTFERAKRAKRKIMDRKQLKEQNE